MPSPKDTKGPVVKTGPTAGQNRSRNQDGTWRKKRSDTGQSRGSSTQQSNSGSSSILNTLFKLLK